MKKKSKQIDIKEELTYDGRQGSFDKLLSESSCSPKEVGRYKYLTYYDNNTAYHFMAQFSIIPILAAESPHIKETFSNQVNNAVLCLAKNIKDHVFSMNGMNDGRFQVAIEINLEKMPNQTLLLIIKDNDVVEVALDELINSNSKPDLLAIVDIIPFKALGDVFVKSEEDKNKFIINNLANVPFKHFNIKVNPEIFEGENLKLRDSIKSKIEKINKNLKYIKNINHMRAALLASLKSTSFPLTNSLVTSYDKKMISILSNLTMQDKNDVLFKSIRNKANRIIIENGYKPPATIFSNDKTPITEFNWLYKSIELLQNDNAIKPDFTEGLMDIKSEENLLDIYSFRILCWLLIDNENYKLMDLLNHLIEEFNSSIKKLNILDESDLQSIIQTYNKSFEKIKKNIEGVSSLPSNTTHQSFSTVITLNHFCMSYDSTDHFSSLKKYIQLKQNINEYQKRLLWFMYGLSYGLHKIDNDFKESINDLTLIDNHMFYHNSPIEQLTPERNEFIIEYDGLHVIFSVVNEYGDLEDMLSELIKKDRDKLEYILLDLKIVPEDFKCFILEWNEKEVVDYIISKKDFSKLILKVEPLIKHKIHWEFFSAKSIVSWLDSNDKKILSIKLANELYGQENAY